jgi:aquaporin NIP
MKRYFAEMIGTFALVFCGTGAIVINQVSDGAVSHLGIAMTFGLIVLGMIYSIGNTSGAHMNPAVTLGFAVAGRFQWKEVAPYWISQVLGALMASLALKLLFPENQNLGGTIPAGPELQSFFLEIILTFFLMFVIMQVATGSKEQGMMAGIAIGGIVALEAAFAGPICGASMNPARSLSPALISGNWAHLWIYLSAPFIGALAGVGAYKVIKP